MPPEMRPKSFGTFEKQATGVLVFVLRKLRSGVFVFVVRTVYENFPAEKAYRLLEPVLAKKYSRQLFISFIDRTQR